MPKRHCIALNEYIQSKRCGSERNVSIKCDPNCEFYIVAKEIDQQRTDMTAVAMAEKELLNDPTSAMAEILALHTTMMAKRRSRRDKKDVEVTDLFK